MTTDIDQTTPSGPLLALTLWRPWPWLILHCGKDVENRPWQTRYRGPLVLHAARRIDVEIADRYSRSHDRAELLAEGFLGTVTITGCHPATECRRRCSEWAGRDGFHWELTDPQPFDRPVPGRGRQRLFSPPSEVLDLMGSR